MAKGRAKLFFRLRSPERTALDLYDLTERVASRRASPPSGTDKAENLRASSSAGIKKRPWLIDIFNRSMFEVRAFNWTLSNRLSANLTSAIEPDFPPGPLSIRKTLNAASRRASRPYPSPGGIHHFDAGVIFDRKTLTVNALVPIFAIFSSTYALKPSISDHDDDHVATPR